MRVLIGDKFGRILTELIGNVGPVSWILNGVGRTSVGLAISDPKAREEYLQVGNRIYLEMDHGLPPWGGVLDMPRQWGGGEVSTSGYGIERLLEFRRTGKNDSFYERSAGEIFREVLRRTEEREPLGIRFGEIWQGGRPHYPRYHYKSLWYVLDYSLPRMERCDFRFVPYLEGDFIRFEARFYQIAGRDRSANTAIVEGRNTADGLRLTEQGQLINDHAAVGDGQTWGPERIVVLGQDAASRARYGLRETGKVYPGVGVTATLQMHVQNVLKRDSEPRRIFNLDVTDDAPGRFADYDLGDLVRCVLPSFGFGGYDGTVRVIGREYDPASGRCTLVVEEPNEPAFWIYQDDLTEEDA